MAAPTLTTQAASAVTKTTATLNGNITATGGVNPTIRGFQYNTVEYPDKETVETGDFSAGAVLGDPIELYRSLFFQSANLKGYWRLENTLNDSSPSGYNLTDHSTSDTASGKFGRGRSLAAASSQYADVANTSCPSLEISGSQTWSCWINPSTVNNNTPVSKTNSDASVLKRLFITNLGKPQFALGGLATNSVITADNAISTGQWYHLVGVYDSTNSLIKLYVNNVKKELPASGSAAASGASFAIGRQGDLAGTYFDGIVDEVAIFDRALSDVEVQELYACSLINPFQASVSGLTPNTLYYFRSYATNSVGTSYGSWETFTTDPATYNITIGGVDRTDEILNQTVTIEDILNDQQNTCNFALIDRSGNGIPATDDEIIITLDDGTILFSGYIQKVDLDKQPNGVILAVCQCIDQVWLLDRNLVHKTYEDMTDKAIIEDIISTYCSGFGITTTNVVEGVTISQISFNYIQPSQAIRKICDVTNRNWYIDYDKDIHYFPLLTNTAPFNIDSTNNDYSNLKISKDNTQLKNRVYVRGGTKLSDPTTYSVKGDGVARQFPLPDKPHDTSMTVNGAAKTIGIKNIDTSGFDYYLNFQEKYLEQDSGGSVLTTSDTLVLTYTYDIPILVAVENTQSIIDNGVKEFAIFDKSITTTQAARDRASAELTDYAADIIEGSFSTYTPGFKSGQYININLTEYDVDADYIVQKVTARSMGGGLYVYDISIASAKTMGIIRFLIELLEANKNLVELDDSESVDELLALTDLLYSDSITETLTIDSAGAYRTWCQDSLEATNTRARWGLFEWGGNS